MRSTVDDGDESHEHGARARETNLFIFFERVASRDRGSRFARRGGVDTIRLARGSSSSMRRETSRSFIVGNRWTRVWEGGRTRACDFYASRVARGRVDARARTTGRERTSERMETDCWLVF